MLYPFDRRVLAQLTAERKKRKREGKKERRRKTIGNLSTNPIGFCPQKKLWSKIRSTTFRLTELANSTSPLPQNFHSLALSVHRRIVGTKSGQISRWISEPLEQRPMVCEFDVIYTGSALIEDRSAEEGIRRGCLASDGAYVYLLTVYGFFKLGTGLCETRAGEVMVCNESVHFSVVMLETKNFPRLETECRWLDQHGLHGLPLDSVQKCAYFLTKCRVVGFCLRLHLDRPTADKLIDDAHCICSQIILLFLTLISPLIFIVDNWAQKYELSG
ncbi:hypothetical protein niasHT_022419 [Heterodera trifolii]|uniref:Uncharacterized protein n=1 Tax=Heterodera trifolii TaxID=157864 RepID=A0ABD2KLT1_9BILA